LYRLRPNESRSRKSRVLVKPGDQADSRSLGERGDRFADDGIDAAGECHGRSILRHLSARVEINRPFMPEYTGKDISMEYDDCSRLLYMTTDIQYG
jgi:hypothetical protein